MTASVPNVLSIAGSDPSGGAGIQADLKTFAALGAYGCAVPSVLTAQNTTAVTGVHPIPAGFLRAQLDAVFSDVRIDAVKVGMLGSRDAVGIVADLIAEVRPAVVVVDPVLRSTTGRALIDDDALALLRDRLLPLATVTTPNAVEAARLLDLEASGSFVAPATAARALVRAGVRAALVTGGHTDTPGVVTDVLCDGDALVEFRAPRVVARATHGTGCTLSSAIAALMAHGASLHDACARAQRFVGASIAHGASLRVGRGAGPVHQLGELWTRAGPLV
jgi:hydroxymethylpyrimidine/phosphomethylpyrimidine kinase